MTFSLPIATRRVTHSTPRNNTPVRVVPAPVLKSFTLEVEWEETNNEPMALPVRVNPPSSRPSSFVTRILRCTTPLELRLDPTL